MSNLKIVPELYVSDINVTKKFYIEVFGFDIKYQRTSEQFVYFTLDGVDIMVEGIAAGESRWISAKMEKPFGRGINFQWSVAELDPLYSRVKDLAPTSIYLEMQTKSYQCGDEVAVQRHFIAQDPDGYLFRFCCDGRA